MGSVYDLLVEYFGKNHHNPLKRKRERDLEPFWKQVKELLHTRTSLAINKIETVLEAIKAHPTPLPTVDSTSINVTYHHLQDRGLTAGNQDFHLLHMQLRHVIEVYFDSADAGHRAFLTGQFSNLVDNVMEHGWKISPAVAAICPYAVVRTFLLLMDKSKGPKPDHIPAVGIISHSPKKKLVPAPAPKWQRPWQLDSAGALFLSPKLVKTYEQTISCSWGSGDSRWIINGWKSVRAEFPSAAEKARVAAAKELRHRMWVEGIESHIMSAPCPCREWHWHEDHCALVYKPSPWLWTPFDTWEKPRANDDHNFQWPCLLERWPLVPLEECRE
eukprot:jgi/Mesvir1/8496/Mv12259-RA.1